VAVSIPYAGTPGSWLGLKILQGLVGAPIECLGEISISDVYFSHQRGTYMAVYALTLYTSGFLAPVFAGFINDSMGWQWVMVRLRAPGSDLFP
jgi:MFS family permease